MKKWLIKLFMPSAETMAKTAAKVAADFVNGCDRQETIAKYSTYADEFTKIQAKVTGWLRDGTVSEQEREELERALLPLARRLREAAI